MANLTSNPIQGAVDLLGYPVGELQRLHDERAARCADPNAQMEIPDEWAHLKQNASLFRKDLEEREIPNILPESLFLKYFLYAFAGLHSKDPEWEKTLKDSTILHDWGKIAGMPHRTVNIVRDGTKEIMFTVPPMFHRMRSIIQTDPRMCFLSLVDATRRHHSRSPLFAERYFRENLQYFSPADSKDHIVADTLQWALIFDKYDAPLWDAKTESHKTVKELGILDGLKPGSATHVAGTTPRRAPDAPTTTTGGVADVEEF